MNMFIALTCQNKIIKNCMTLILDQITEIQKEISRKITPFPNLPNVACQSHKQFLTKS